jgi:hypothetical protein
VRLPTLTLPRKGGGQSHLMICSAAHLIVMTGLDPVIHGNVAAREDVDGRIKSGHDQERATWPNAIALRKGGGDMQRFAFLPPPPLRGRVGVGGAARADVS